MEKLTTDKDLAVRRQFAGYCKKVIYHAAVDYIREIKKSRTRETSMELLSQEERNKLIVVDKCELEYEQFPIAGSHMKVDIHNEKLVQAINQLSDRKREILLLSFVEEESDTQIAERLHLDRSTVSEHRRTAIAQLRKILTE